MKASSNSDCLNDPSFESGDCADFWCNRKYWIRVGTTSVVAIAPLEGDGEVVLQPTGRGYVANKNKMIGAVRKRVRVES